MKILKILNYIYTHTHTHKYISYRVLCQFPEKQSPSLLWPHRVHLLGDPSLMSIYVIPALRYCKPCCKKQTSFLTYADIAVEQRTGITRTKSGCICNYDGYCQMGHCFFSLFLKFIFNWRIITLQYCAGFCCTTT